MRDALNCTGRPILFSTEPFDLTPNPQAHISNLWRTTTDVSDDVSKVLTPCPYEPITTADGPSITLSY